MKILQRKNRSIPLPKVFCFVCFVKDNRTTVGKLDSKAVKAFLWVTLVPKRVVYWSSIERRLFVSIYVIF
jgi:hypothetical protein